MTESIEMPTFLEYADIQSGLTDEEWRNERNVGNGPAFIKLVYERDNSLEVKLLFEVLKEMEKERMSILKSIISIEDRRIQIIEWKSWCWGREFVDKQLAKGRKSWEIEIAEKDVGRVVEE